MKTYTSVYWKNNMQRVREWEVEWAKELIPLLVVILIASAVFLLEPGAGGPDVTNYLNTGRRLMQGESYIPSPLSTDYGKSSFRGPFYSILFAFSFSLFGLSISSALLVSKFAAFGSFILVYLLLRNVFDVKTGLVTVALTATSFYMMTFPVSFNIDLIMSFFILLSLLCIVIALKKQSLKVGIAAGMVMGIAVLVKELSLLWLPIIVYLFLGVAKWRNKKNLSVVIGYFLGSAVAAGIWWLIYFIQTGSLFLISSVPPSATKIIQLVLALVLVLLPLLALAYRFRQRIIVKPWSQGGLSLSIRHLFVFGWILWIIVTIVITIALSSRTSFRFDLHPEVVMRIKNFLDYVKIFILPDHPLFQYLPVTIAIIILSAAFIKRHGNDVLLWMVLASMPIILTAYMPNIYVMPTRYFFPFYWLAYMILGRGLVVALDGINVYLSNIVHNYFDNRLKNLHLTSLFLLFLIPYSWQTSWTTTSSYTYSLRSTDNYLGENVLEVSKWLKDNVSPGSNIVAAGAFHTGYQFFTEGKFNFFRWESFNESLDDTSWAVESQVSLEKKQQGIQLLSKRNTTYTLPVLHPLYIEYGFDLNLIEDFGSGGSESVVQVELVPRFFTISEEDLIDFLKKQNIDYIILPESSFSHSRLFESIPSYFNDSPAFEHQFLSQWTEGNESYAIHVFKVNRENLTVIDYPTIVPIDTWKSLESRAQGLVGDQYDVFMLIRALGGGPIILSNSSETEFTIYKEIADAYLENNQFDLAAFEYHLALQIAPEKIDELFESAKQFTSHHPEVVSPWLLLGDIYHQQGKQDLAEKSYHLAIAAPNGNDHAKGVAYQMLGKISLAKGDYTEANAFFKAAVAKSSFGREGTQKNLLLVQANLLLSQGNLDHAFAYFTEYFSEEPSSGLVSASSANTITSFDFLKQYVRTSLGKDPKVRPAVFIVNEKVIPTLFAHPNSEMRFTLDLPSGALLNFAPVLDPSAWQYGKGDGVQFRINLTTQKGSQYVIYDEYLDPKNITSQRILLTKSVDLSQWAGQRVTIDFSTGCGPNDDCRFDWAGWGEPHISQPVEYNFVDHLEEADKETLGASEGLIEVITQTINYDTRTILFQHPSSRVTYSVTLPTRASIQFGLGTSQEVWSAENSDGVEYTLYVRSLEDPLTLHKVYQRKIDPMNNPDDRRWFDERIDLSSFGGQEVEIIFEAMPGPAENFDFDWGGWGNPVLVDDTITSTSSAQVTDRSPNTP